MRVTNFSGSLTKAEWGRGGLFKTLRFFLSGQPKVRAVSNTERIRQALAKKPVPKPAPAPAPALLPLPEVPMPKEVAPAPEVLPSTPAKQTPSPPKSKKNNVAFFRYPTGSSLKAVWDGTLWTLTATIVREGKEPLVLVQKRSGIHLCLHKLAEGYQKLLATGEV